MLAALLHQNAGLVHLNLAGNSGLPDRLLHAASLAASCSGLQTLDLSSCELLRPGAYVPDAFPALTWLDISNTAATDADVQAIATGLPQLQHLALRGCRRVRALFVPSTLSVDINCPRARLTALASVGGFGVSCTSRTTAASHVGCFLATTCSICMPLLSAGSWVELTLLP